MIRNGLVDQDDGDDSFIKMKSAEDKNVEDL